MTPCTTWDRGFSCAPVEKIPLTPFVRTSAHHYHDAVSLFPPVTSIQRSMPAKHDPTDVLSTGEHSPVSQHSSVCAAPVAQFLFFPLPLLPLLLVHHLSLSGTCQVRTGDQSSRCFCRWAPPALGMHTHRASTGPTIPTPCPAHQLPRRRVRQVANRSAIAPALRRPRTKATARIGSTGRAAPPAHPA
jgi:hypothetical protein